MTVLDTSGVIDYLLGSGVAAEVGTLLDGGPAAVPDVLVIEVLAVIRREVRGQRLDHERARSVIEDLGDIPLEVFPSMALRSRAWELHENLTGADALFVSLAERLDEPFATKDQPLAMAVTDLTGVEVIRLGT